MTQTSDASGRLSHVVFKMSAETHRSKRPNLHYKQRQAAHLTWSSTCLIIIQPTNQSFLNCYSLFFSFLFLSVFALRWLWTFPHLEKQLSQSKLCRPDCEQNHLSHCGAAVPQSRLLSSAVPCWWNKLLNLCFTSLLCFSAIIKWK